MLKAFGVCSVCECQKLRWYAFGSGVAVWMYVCMYVVDKRLVSKGSHLLHTKLFQAQAENQSRQNRNEIKIKSHINQHANYANGNLLA